MLLETFGSIIKEEQVKTFERGILANTFVLENLGYFPGYYGADLPIDREPDSLFLVMTQKESTEKILRLTHNIKKQTGLNFEGTPASLCVYNNTYNAIRVRHLKYYDQIDKIQEYYRDSGIVFMKRKSLNESAVIQIKKVFRFNAVDEKILKDGERNMYYLKINHQLTWSHFKNVTKQVRNNIELSAFDAALVVIYGSEVLDLVRIYSESLNTDELKMLHDKYEEIIEKSLK
jgi:hypothetical protein